jgi:hypothetical protein
MTKTERELRAELYEKNRQLQAITKQAAQQQERIAELEAALGRVFKETVQYAR